RDRLGLPMAGQYRSLAAFFIVHHEWRGEACPSRPLRVGWPRAIADQVAIVIHGHAPLPCPKPGGAANFPALLWRNLRRTAASASWTPQAMGSTISAATRSRRRAA